MKNLYTLIIIISLILLSACEKNTSPEQSQVMARQAIEDGELNKAIILIKNAILLKKDNASLRVTLGELYIRLGDLAYAAKELNKAQELGASADKWLIPLIQVNYLQNEHLIVEKLWHENKQKLKKKELYKANLFYALSLLSQKKKVDGIIELERLASDIEHKTQHDQKLALILLQLMSPNIETKDISQSIQQLNVLANNNQDNWLTWLLLSKSQFSFKDFKNAAVSYQHVSNLLPKFDIARIYAAESNIEAGNNSIANTQLTTLLKLYPTQPYINLLFAKNSMIMRDFEAAKMAIEKTIASNFSDYATKLIAGITYYQLGEYENAYSYLTSIAKNLPQQHPAKKILIATQLKLGHNDRAYSALNKEPIDEKDTALIATAAHSLLAENKTQQASELLKRLHVSQASSPALAIEISRLKYAVGDRSSLGDLEETIQSITSDTAISATDIHKARTMILASLIQDKQLTKARNTAEEWIHKEPKNISNYLLLIEIEKRMKNKSKISNIYKMVLKIDPNFISAKLYFAVKYFSQKNYANALKAYDEIITLSPKNIKAIVGKYHVLAALDKNTEANTFIQKLLAQEDENFTLSLTLAKSHYRMGNFEQALQLLSNKQYSSNPDNIEKYNIMAISHLKQKNKLEAIATYNKILELTPTDTVVFTQKILTMETLGLYSEIITDIEKFKSNQTYDDPRINLLYAEYLTNADRANEGMDILSNYKNTDIAQNPIYKGILAKTLYMLKEYIKATPLLEKEYDRENNSRTATMLYNAYMRTQLSEKANKFVKKHLIKFPEDLLFINIYAEYLFNTDRDKSINEYKKLLTIDNKNGIALNNLAWIFYQKKEYAKAKSYIEQAVKYYPKNKNILDTAAKIASETK